MDEVEDLLHRIALAETEKAKQDTIIDGARNRLRAIAASASRKK